MKKGLIVLLVIGLVIALLAGTVISKYNKLVVLNEEVKTAESQIDNQLQRRNDLIPNLVETVKAYASHEKEIFEGIADARAAMMGASSITDKAQADAALNSSLGRLLAISENYPDLKANENFIQLSDELAGTENRIAVARMEYNESAKNFNKVAKSFPMVIFAKMLGFDEAKYFEAVEGAENVPAVDFGN